MGGGNLVGSEIGGGERRMWEDCLLAVCPTGGKRKGGRGEGGSTDFLPLGRRVCSFLILPLALSAQTRPFFFSLLPALI